MSNIVIENIIKDSIANELNLKNGDKIISINGVYPKDIIEYSFLINDENIDLLVEHENKEQEEFEIEKDIDEDLGITFTSAVFDGLKRCLNHCIFCFVDQQPEGLRDSLYIKDDDWRLSYLHGTYVTLSNFKEEDWERIEKYHISPLFVSVHTTNPLLREKMLKNPNAKNIIEQLRRFKKIKTKLHCQIVLCPGYNDGEELKRTLNDLKEFKSIIKSIAVVPVGISKFRKENLKKVDKKIAKETIKTIEDFNNSIKKQIATAADEFFVLSGIEVPEKKYYGDFFQIEDGVGAIRLLKDSFKKCTKKLKKKIKNKTKLTIATASTAYNIFSEFKKEINVENLTFEVLNIKNSFFGSDINVAGLVTGCDIIKTIKDKDIEHLVLSSVMLKKNGDGFEEVFLDGITLNDIKKVKKDMQIHIIQNNYGFEEILKIINSL